MGTLIAMAYPTKLFAKAADHTYVKCQGGGKAWGCWGGKTGGKQIRKGTGSTKRANAIAQPNERAGIKCYLINGVCHQAANRVLLPAGVLVSKARGYKISESLFGPYGRVGSWPCKAPFKKYPNVTGDLAACRTSASELRRAEAVSAALSPDEKLDWNYIQSVLQIYDKATKTMQARSVTPESADAQEFHMALFMNMVNYNLGAMQERKTTSRLKQVRRKIEKQRLKVEAAYAAEEMTVDEFVEAFDKTTINFQDELASVLTPAQYKTLFDLKPNERVVLADPAVTKRYLDAD